MYLFWPESYHWSFQMMRALSESQFGGGDINECFEVGNKIKSGDVDSWASEWEAMGRKVLSMAEEAERNKHYYTARRAYFRAANYFRLAEFELKPNDHRRQRLHPNSVRCFKKGCSYLDIPPELVEIPYDGSFLPGYLFKPDNSSEPRPIIVFIGGLDSTAEELYFTAGKSLVEAGFQCLLVEGPGQGSALRYNKLYSRADYDYPIGKVIDYLESRDDVMNDKIALMGMSMGGYYSTRAATAEHRLAGVLIWCAYYDYGAAWMHRGYDHPLSHHIQWVLGVDNMDQVKEKLKDFNNIGRVENIKCPVFIMHGADDPLCPPSQAYDVYDRIKVPNKRLKVFTAAEGGSAHCQYDNLNLAHYYMINWFEELFKG
jgi:dipeptidyl aminopeptidase/acylaminoacyl peptidase